MKVTLHIESLVLNGLPLKREDQRSLRASVERELARLLARDGLHPALTASGAISALNAPVVPLDAGKKPAELGRWIAGAIHRGIGT
jgi:hypothetical protein